MTKRDILEIIRQSSYHHHIYVRTGAARALGKLGNNSDRNLLKKMLKENNANVVAAAVRGLVRIGTGEDIDFIRKLQDDKRTEIKGAVAYVLAHRGLLEDETVIFNLLQDDNIMVRRDAVIALGIRAEINPDIKTKVSSTMEALLNDSNEEQQVLKEAKKVIKKLKNEPYDFTDSHERYVRKLTIDCYKLDNTYTENSSKKAHELLLHRIFTHQEVGIRWMIEHETHNIPRIIDELESKKKLDFRVIEMFDYYLYCPQWWQNAMKGI